MKSNIIYVNNVATVLNHAYRKKTGYFFILSDNGMLKDRELLKACGLKEIVLYELSEKEKINNEKEYIRTISALSAIYNSIEWWANAVSEKNEHLSSHYKNIVLFYCLINTLKAHMDTPKTIFVICNDEIIYQLKAYCKKEGIVIKSLESKLGPVFRKAIFYSCFFINISVFFAKILFKKLYISFLLSNRIRESIDTRGAYYVIRTWLDRRFLEKNDNLQDALFGSLPGDVIRRGHNLIILARISDDYFNIIRKIKDAKGLVVIPEYYFLAYSDLLRLLTYLRLNIKRPTKKIIFSGVDITNICEEEIKRGYLSTDYVQNILSYFIARNFARAVNIETYVQTFENYAWEKLTILGIKETKSDCSILGFQHAFISRNSFKYFPGKEEKDIMPLPDKIISMGRMTRDILEKHGMYDGHILTTGCALRQEYIKNIQPFRRRSINRILVPLTMVRNENIRILDFLYHSGLPGTKYEIAIRPHPSFPYEKFRNQISFKMPGNFTINNKKTVIEEFKETGIVFYTWSTVAVEALKIGIPVVYLDIMKPMFVDPLFECDALKRIVSKKEELLPTIEGLYNIEDESFFREQTAAQEYLKEYFYPVNPDNLKSFFNR